MPIRLAIVGAGTMGAVYARAVAKGNLRWRASVVGVCDVNRAAADGLARDCGAEAFTDLAELIERTRPDAVYVAVPDHLHAEPFLTCIEHQVPCLVEKPLATELAEAARMRDAAERAGVYVECNFTNRSNPVFAQAREAVERGDLGQVIAVNARLSNTVDYPTQNLSWAGKTSSGWFLLSHVFDLTTWLTGARASEVTASGVSGRLRSLGVDTYDVIQCLVRYDAELSGLYESSWTLPSSSPSPVDFKVEILGAEGAIYVDTQDQMIHLAGRDALTYPSTLDWTEARLTAFLDAVEAGKPPTGQLDDAVHNTALLTSLHEALRTGRPVMVPTAPATSDDSR